MTKDKVTTEYKGHPVMTREFIQHPYNEEHLKKNLELMDAAVKRHNKVFSWRMDIHMPVSNDKVKVKKAPREFIKEFLSCYTNKLARMGLDPDYVVKMEQKSSGNPHFHAQFLADGNKVKDHKHLALMGEELIERQLKMDQGDGKGLIHYNSGSKDSYMIRRNSPCYNEQFDACFKRMSYLAKQDPDDKIPSSERKISYSRYNRKKCRSKQ